MSFWKSDLIKNLEKGLLPSINTEVTVDDEKITKLIVIITLSVILIILFIFLLKRL